jgi:CubicO group peptidase (beta-lactamase class C family)
MRAMTCTDSDRFPDCVSSEPMDPSRFSLDPAGLDHAFAVAASQAADETAPFVIVGVATADRVVRLEAYSPSDRPRLGAGWAGPIASISKPIVATVILQLVAEGRLGLGDDLRDIVPGLGRGSRPRITPWHVLGHTSGIQDVDLFELMAVGTSRETVLEAVLNAPQVAPPGSRFEYVTGTWELLAATIEAIDGSPFDACLVRRLFEPLGMASTAFDPRPTHAGRIVPVAYGSMGRGQRPEDILDAGATTQVAGGGLWSTAHDLLRFGRAMLQGGELDGVRVLPPAFVELMTRESTVDGLGRHDDPLESHHYALGWGLPGPTMPGSRVAFGHGGATGTRLWIDPASGLVFVYLTAVWGFPVDPIDRVMNAMYAALR